MNRDVHHKKDLAIAYISKVLHDNVPDGHLVDGALLSDLLLEEPPLALSQGLVSLVPLDGGLGNTSNDSLEGGGGAQSGGDVGQRLREGRLFSDDGKGSLPLSVTNSVLARELKGACLYSRTLRLDFVVIIDCYFKFFFRFS